MIILCLIIIVTVLNDTVMSMSSASRVIIAGGGIHGVSLAYYLTQKGIKPLIIEKSSIAAAASGKAGGFLAREWGSGPTVQLHQQSFDLHEQLAKQFDIQSYRRVNTLSVDGNRKGKNVASWLDQKVSSSLMDTATAQVTPKEFTLKILEAAMAGGAEVLIDSIEDIITSSNEEGSSKVVGVQTAKSGIIDASYIAICLGPWSGVAAEDWLDMSLPMDGVKSTSLVFDDLQPIKDEPFACFCAEDINGCHLELYPRPNGELYICGCGGSDYVSGDRLRKGGDCESADLIVADPKRVAAATASLRGMSSLGKSEPSTAQACMRPCTPDARPVMGRIPGLEGGFISCGHNCWGILWAPISGLAMAELMVEGKSKTVDLSPFAPDRFMKPLGHNKRRKDGDAAQNTRGRKKGSADVGEQW